MSLLDLIRADDWANAHAWWLMVPIACAGAWWLVAWARRRSRPSAAFAWPVVRIADRAAARSLRSRLFFLPALCRLGLLVCLVAAIARPQADAGRTLPPAQSRAIVLTLDRSGSMDEPVYFEGRETTRLDAAKAVLSEFIEGDRSVNLRGRAGDLLGLVVFGTYADTLSPIAQDHRSLLETLDRVEIPIIQSEQGTAIGEAINVAAARLRTLEVALEQRDRELSESTPEERLTGKAIVLLTDGENTQGEVEPIDAARRAAEWGIRLYIIGIRGGASQRVGGRRIPLGRDVNEPAMRQAAELTGGRFFPVEDVANLPQVYAAIDELEPAPVQREGRTLRDERFAPFAVCALALLLLEAVLRRTWLRWSP